MQAIDLRFARVLVVTLVVQAVLVAIAMPASQALTDASLWYIDNPYQLYQIELGRALLRHGSLVGYDPFFGGGYVGGVSYNVSGRIPVLLSWIVPGSVRTRDLYVAYVATCAITAPPMVTWLAQRLGWSYAQIVAASVAGTLFWWCGAFRWYHTAGMVSFVFACYLSAPYAVSLRNLCRAATVASRPAIIVVSLVGALGFWIHPLFPVLAAFLFVPLVCAEPRAIERRRLIGVCVTAGIIALVLDAPWLLAMSRTTNLAGEQPYQRAVDSALFWRPLLGQWSGMGTLLNPACLVVCLVAPFNLQRCELRKIAPFLVAGFGLLTCCAFSAAFAFIAPAQPNRLVAPAFLFIAIAAAYVLGAAARRSRGRSLPAQVVVLLVGVAALSYGVRETAREVSSEPHGHFGKIPPELTGPPAVLTSLASWIDAQTTADARILFETSLARVHGGGHVAGQLALATHRELIGGAYPFIQPAGSFWDGHGFGQPIASLEQERFRDGLEHYNVGWIVAHSAQLQTYLGQFAEVREETRFGSIVVYKVHRAHSFAEGGTPIRVYSTFDRIEVDAQQENELVLRYHWVPGLSITRPARIEPATVQPGFPPLIRVVNAPSHFVISMCSACTR